MILCYMQPNAILVDGDEKFLQIFMNVQSSRVSESSRKDISKLRTD